MRKLRNYIVMSSSKLISCSIREMWKIVNFNQNKRLMLKSYPHEINTSIFPNRHYVNIFYEKLVNELHDWMENNPHVTHSPILKDSNFVKINGIIVKNRIIYFKSQYKSFTIIWYYQFPREIFWCKNCWWKSMYWRYVT